MINRIIFLLIITYISPSNAQLTASITNGIGTTINPSVFDCGRRPAPTGTITSTDNKTWSLPSAVNFENGEFPSAPDLYNNCIGVLNNNTAQALANLNPSDIVEIDPDGAFYSAFVFADNYYEMYINGVAVGKDKVPFTEFNSSIIQFKVKKPFTIAMLLVDWEEGLGIGTESSPRVAHHAGDGGVVAVIRDDQNNIVAITNKLWKAQTYYTSPIKDINCFTENGSLRNSENCNVDDSDIADNYLGLHWERPNNWQGLNFDDSSWPNAYEYTNELIGVNNRASYTNFIDVFDDPLSDAVFIWSSNIILDNEVLVRYTVRDGGTAVYPNRLNSKASKIEDEFKLNGQKLMDKSSNRTIKVYQ